MDCENVFFDTFDEEINFLVHWITFVCDESFVVEDGDTVLFFHTIDVGVTKSNDSFEVDGRDGDVCF